ncbi:F0F1 ATP synthase subunit epsilon [Chloroflexus aggregans]|jgi:F-type H+-transporting ATPase subunit epsilon|uniref:ATP synthase epsilon chain n=1 Tax=Chloroflexus aggregans (strain MD-66 / DSM 9485) TaxID=326427 RepID=ATPE_CHLAD|nr:F0F1 ATP synthase subunit epsilon [Chloroflexus aggregans]B8G6G5.1 RecName: Full=ATP synthase epsilon chain; AltName: Full=ATP synthase F1 sector epsilon subunit; AltName: Full=F-ATPase epsilon subunit [Chloroflexus aggregans DSM 9485]ACL23902.1 ATP synthase F1, epsilon subunit [Chloroflexus aggregans DSM 9485]RMD74579.1 MAG: F0F1 ATP synthase subunit epsilon [Chloroflexota bacterium]
MPIHLEIVTAERVILSDDVDMISVPTKDGRVGILPRHAPLMTILEPGELDIIKNGERTPFAVSGGFMEVLPHRVTILADTVERADEIDEARAEQARAEAEARRREAQSEHDMALAEAKLRKEMVRLRVAQLHKIKRRQS